jgi:hypothetical protein
MAKQIERLPARRARLGLKRTTFRDHFVLHDDAIRGCRTPATPCRACVRCRSAGAPSDSSVTKLMPWSMRFAITVINKLQHRAARKRVRAADRTLING